MNAQQFEAARRSLDMLKAEFADALGVDVKVARAYALGGRPIPKTVGLAAWALLMQPRIARLVPSFLASPL